MRTAHRGPDHIWSALIAFVALTGIVAGCGAAPGSTISTTATLTAAASGTPTATPTPASAATTLFLASSGTTAYPLHVQIDDGIACAANPQGGPTLAASNLVLTRDPTSYDAGTLQGMDAYVGDVLTHIQMDGLSATSPPDGLTWSYGALTGTGAHHGCKMTLEVTNIGSDALDVTQVDVRLLGSPQPNTQSYPLIDLCSFPSASVDYCTGWGAAAGPCSVYTANITLQGGTAGNIASSALSGLTPNCPEPLLNPGDTVTLAMTITSSGAQANLSYPVVPEITVQDQNGQRVVPLDQFDTILAFADASQFSCFGTLDGALVPLGAPNYTTLAGSGFCL